MQRALKAVAVGIVFLVSWVAAGFAIAVPLAIIIALGRFKYPILLEDWVSVPFVLVSAIGGLVFAFFVARSFARYLEKRSTNA